MECPHGISVYKGGKFRNVLLALRISEKVLNTSLTLLVDEALE